MNKTKCCICLKPCEIAGTHRQAFINCGHYFGEMCIRRKLDERPCCPKCNANAREEDIRIMQDGVKYIRCPICDALCLDLVAHRKKEHAGREEKIKEEKITEEEITEETITESLGNIDFHLQTSINCDVPGATEAQEKKTIIHFGVDFMRCPSCDAIRPDLVVHRKEDNAGREEKIKKTKGSRRPAFMNCCQSDSDSSMRESLDLECSCPTCGATYTTKD